MSYQQLFDEMIGTSPPTGLSVDVVIGRELRTSRRRQMVGACAAIVLVVVAVGIAKVSDGDRAAVPSASRPAAGLLPQYHDGMRLTAASIARLPGQTTMSVTFTPISQDFVLVGVCHAPTGVTVATIIGGSNEFPFPCTPHPRLDTGIQFSSPNVINLPANDLMTADGDLTQWHDRGLRIGHPYTVTASVPAGNAAAGIAEIGVYEPVSFDDYVFPPPPDRFALPDMSGTLPDVLFSVTADESPTATATIQMPDVLTIGIATVMPGSVRVYLDGAEYAHCDAWTWNFSCGSLPPEQVGKGPLANFSPGQVVTVDVVTVHLAGPDSWQVVVSGQR